jgi:hypothetical protein
MADIESNTPIDEVPADDMEMDDSATGAGAGNETGLTEMEPETPKLVLFAEYVCVLSHPVFCDHRLDTWTCLAKHVSAW